MVYITIKLNTQSKVTLHVFKYSKKITRDIQFSHFGKLLCGLLHVMFVNISGVTLYSKQGNIKDTVSKFHQKY